MHGLERDVDPAVLPLHDLDDRRRLGGPVQQQRPDALVLGRVVVLQDGVDQADVLGEHVGARGVPGRHAAHEGRREPKLPAEHRVDHEHVAYVGLAVLRHVFSRVYGACHGTGQ